MTIYPTYMQMSTKPVRLSIKACILVLYISNPMKESQLRDYRLHYGNIAMLNDQAMITGNPRGGPANHLFEEFLPDGGGIITILSGQVSWSGPKGNISVKGCGVVMFESERQVPGLTFSEDFRGYMTGLCTDLIGYLLTDFSRSGFPARIAGWPVIMSADTEMASILSRTNLLLIDEMAKGDGASHEEIIRLLIKVLYCKIMDEFDLCRDEDFSSSESKAIREFLKLLSRYGSTQRTLTFYAGRIGITPKYLSSLISRETGRTSRQWFEEMTMSKARFLLRNTDMPIYQISDALNFPSPTNFTRYFRSAQKTTPLKYRNR